MPGMFGGMGNSPMQMDSWLTRKERREKKLWDALRVEE